MLRCFSYDRILCSVFIIVVVRRTVNEYEESRTHRTSSRSSYSLDYFYSETEGKKSFAFAPLFLREIDNGVKSRWSRSLYLYRRCCCRVLHTLPYCRIRIFPVALFGSLSLTVSSVRSLLLASTTGNSFY